MSPAGADLGKRRVQGLDGPLHSLLRILFDFIDHVTFLFILDS
jgi:hypothetical protein